MFHMCFDVANQYTNASIKQQVTGPTSCSHLSIGCAKRQVVWYKKYASRTHFLKLAFESYNLTSCDLWALAALVYFQDICILMISGVMKIMVWRDDLRLCLIYSTVTT